MKRSASTNAVAARSQRTPAARTSSRLAPPSRAASLPLWGVLLLAFVLRLATVLWLSDTVPYSDAAFYHLAGQKIVENWGFPFDRSQVEYYGRLGWWPPFYPVFLASLYSLFGVHHRVAVFAQVLLGTFVCWLVYRTGKRAGGERLGLIAALLVAIDPTYIFLGNQLASENLFVVLFALGLWLVGKEWRTARGCALAGVLFGLGALTRAIGVLVPVVAALWLRSRFAGDGRREASAAGPDSQRSAAARGRAASRRAWLVASAWLVGASAITIAPWTLRNWIVAGSPALVCFGGGLNFYYGHNEVSVGYRDWKQTPMGTLQTQHDIDAMGYQLGLQYLAQHPLGFFTRGARKVGALFGPPAYAPHGNSAILMPEGWRTDPEKARLGEELRARQRAKNRWLDGLFTWLAGIHSYALLAGALAACLFFRRRLPAELQLGAYLCLYWILSHVVFWGQPRFRYPMEVPMALLAAFALTEWMHRSGSQPRVR